MQGAFLLKLRREFKELKRVFKLCKEESIFYLSSKIIP